MTNFECFHCNKKSSTRKQIGLFSNIPTGWLQINDTSIKPNMVCSDLCATLATKEIYRNRQESCRHTTGFRLADYYNKSSDRYICNFCNLSGKLLNNNFRQDELPTFVPDTKA